MTQQSYTMIKPDAIAKKDKIVAMITDAGFKIVKSKDMQMDSEFAGKFYAEHQGKPFFDGLVEFMTSGPVYAMVIEKENCIADFRDFIGNTNPTKAKSGSIRSLFGGELPHNAIHASDSPKSASREISLIFN
jgi:nucleoside-diphosphate kinase